MLNNTIRFFLENKLVAFLLLLLFVGWGLATAPFDYNIEQLPRDPVAVDAIPDIGENQQIVFTRWMGRSPQDVEDQITYPLTTALLGIPGVKSVRSNSMFGFSSIYLIFNDDIEFYWSRSRILEKLNSLPANTLPEGVQPTLGPDATALGQIYWYTLEGRDRDGNPTGGWDLDELRTVQDFYVRYGLSAAEGVAEVASIGGYVREYQIDVDPQRMKANNVTLEDVMRAIKQSNIDIGAQTIEINLAEYFVRGLGYIQNVADIENSVVKSVNNVPLTIGDIARVSTGPATRRGVLDKSGAEVVGGVVVARYGANPLEVIQNVKAKIAELQPGLPTRELADGRVSQVNIIPFYDRTNLINETIGTLEEALTLEILITVIVVILMLLNLKSSLLVAGTLPVAVLMCFIAMKYFSVDANIVALSGIAIAIGTMVDMGIVLTESIVNRIENAPPEESLFTTIYEATTEVASAVLTAVATTIISFLPVFTMEAAEGKLFKPLAYTKTFALVAAIIVAITIIPPLAHLVFRRLPEFRFTKLSKFSKPDSQNRFSKFLKFTKSHTLRLVFNILCALVVTWFLATVWMPLGVNKSELINFLFITLIAGTLIGFFHLVIYSYENILRFLLRFKLLFLALISGIIFLGFTVYQNTGEEFMPALDEGSFLLMPTSMPHAGMQANLQNLRMLDMAVTAIPEVETVVGKAGRVNSPLDPAPMSMYENVILYKSEYKTDKNGHRVRFRYKNGDYILDDNGELIPDDNGRYFRQWRDHIKSPDDIWNEIVKVTKLPGVTSAPKLQPIETRLVMLQTGMRAPMGIKVRGSDLATIEAFGLELEQHLKEVAGVKDAAVFADRIVGKPYMLLDIDRAAIGRYGLTIETVQRHIQATVGGMQMTNTVEGRERYAVRVRYPRELRNDPAGLKDIYVPTNNGQQIPLADLVTIRYEQGPQSIKSEDGFLIGYVLFDREKEFSEVEVVNNVQNYLAQLVEDGTLKVPAGISYRFAGNYEQQVRASNRLAIVVPIALAIIFLILYFQFRSIAIAAMVFTGVFIAFAGGFIMIGLYDTDWFLNFNLFSTNLRDLFQIQTINLSVAVWVGFLALFGIATDDGVLVATFLQDSFKKNPTRTIPEIRDAVVEGGLRRVRPAMMTTATTILALLPILTSTGRGADIMLPMAIPSFGGMALQVITMFTVPVLFALWEETKVRVSGNQQKIGVGLVILCCFMGSGNSYLSAQSTIELTNIAIQNNRELQTLELQYRAALERAPQVNELPDPEIGVGLFPFPVETRLGAQRARISAMQMFPQRGLLQARADLEDTKAIALYERIAARQLTLRYEIEQAYYQLYELKQSQVVIRRNLELLASLEELALAKVASSQGTVADVLRVQLKTEALRQELAILQAKSAKPLVTINQLLNRPLDTPVQITGQLTFAELPILERAFADSLTVNHPALRIFQLQQAISEQAIEVSNKSNQPTYGIGADYLLVTPRTDAEPNNNGRDILQIRGTVRIPLFKEKYAAKEREERLKIQALENQQADLREQFLAIIERAKADHATAVLQRDLYQKQSEITQAAIDILQSRYSAAGQQFDELLRLEMELIEYDLKTLRAIVQSHLAKAKLEQFIINK